MKNVLFIAYYFPPMGLGGVQRAVKFVKYLPVYGWDPIVLTVKPVTYYADDFSLLEEVGDGRVIRTESYDPLRILKKIFRHRIIEATECLKTSDRFNSMKASHSLFRSLLFPDSKVLWLPEALKHGEKLIRKCSIDLIFTTSPPQSSHLLGYILHRRTGIPWVMDYRDDWTGQDDLTLPTPIHRAASRWLTRKIIRKANSVIGVSDPIVSSLSCLREGRCVCTIPNGYDRPDFPQKSRKKTDIFTLTYCGTLNSMIRPDSLFKALQSLFSDTPDLRSQIFVRFLGCVIGFSMERLIRRYGLQDVVEWSGYKNHQDSVQAMCESDSLLLFLPKSMSQGMVTGKIYEYLATGRPIMAIVPPGEAQRIVIRHARGAVIDPEDIPGLTCHIRRSYELWKRGDLELSVPPWEGIEKYDRKIQTERVAQIFDTALNTHIAHETF